LLQPEFNIQFGHSDLSLLIDLLQDLLAKFMITARRTMAAFFTFSRSILSGSLPLAFVAVFNNKE
jgi:hypothetical protein